MKPHSLLRRVLIRLALTTGVTLIATLALLYWQFESATGVTVDNNLSEVLKQVSALIRLDESGEPVAELPADFPFTFDERHFVVVADQMGQAHISFPPGQDHVYHPFSSHQTDKPQFFEHRYTDSSDTYLGVTAHIELGGKHLWVQVVDEVPYWQTLAYYSIELFVQGISVLIVLHLLVSAFVCYQAVRTTLIPVRRAAAEARRIGPRTAGIRIDTTKLPEEVLPLAVAANAALDRMAGALDAQKRFTADAAHEILTPLAVIRAEAESLDDPERVKALIREIDEMAEMARQLLELAELDAMEAPPDEPCDLRAIAEDVVARFAAQAIEQGIEPRLTGATGPVMVRGCTSGLRSAFGNLIRNAIQHAEGASSLEIRVEPPGRVSVIDDGPGVPAAERPLIFERFHSAGTDPNGNRGLGLAIVKRLVDSLGGSVSVTDGPGGQGAAFVMVFPADDT